MLELFDKKKPLSLISEDINKKIFSFFDLHTLSTIKRVNKNWREVALKEFKDRCVWIRIWLPNSNNRGKVGHISLQTFYGGLHGKGIYASYHPSDTVTIMNLFRYRSGIFIEKPEDDEDTQNGQPPDFEIKLYSLNIEIINREFINFKNTNNYWSTQGSSLLKFRKNNNCCGLVAYLLYAGATNRIKKNLENNYPYYFKPTLEPFSYWPIHVKKFQSQILILIAFALLSGSTVAYITNIITSSLILTIIAGFFASSAIQTAYLDYQLLLDNLITPSNFCQTLLDIKKIENKQSFLNIPFEMHTIEQTVNIKKTDLEQPKIEVTKIKNNLKESIRQIKIGLGEMFPLFSLCFTEFLPKNIVIEENDFWILKNKENILPSAKDLPFKLIYESEKAAEILHSKSEEFGFTDLIFWLPKNDDQLSSSKLEHISLRYIYNEKIIYISFWPKLSDDKKYETSRYLLSSLISGNLRTLKYDFHKLSSNIKMVRLNNVHVYSFNEKLRQILDYQIDVQDGVSIIKYLLSGMGFNLEIPIDYYHKHRLKKNPFQLYFPATITGAFLGAYSNGLKGFCYCGLISCLYSIVYYHVCLNPLKKQEYILKFDCLFDGAAGSAFITMLWGISRGVLLGYDMYGIIGACVGFLVGVIAGSALMLLGIPIYILLSALPKFISSKSFFATPQEIYQLFRDIELISKDANSLPLLISNEIVNQQSSMKDKINNYTGNFLKKCIVYDILGLTTIGIFAAQTMRRQVEEEASATQKCQIM